MHKRIKQTTLPRVPQMCGSQGDCAKSWTVEGVRSWDPSKQGKMDIKTMMMMTMTMMMMMMPCILFSVFLVISISIIIVLIYFHFVFFLGSVPTEFTVPLHVQKSTAHSMPPKVCVSSYEAAAISHLNIAGDGARPMTDQLLPSCTSLQI